MPQLLVFGARNLGRVIAEHLIAQGWEATGVARSEETVAAFPGRGLQADLTDRDQMRRVVEEAGAFDLAVNAYSPKGRLVGASLADRGAGTLIQVAGGSARRALPGRAPWASGAAATRALSQAAANELKPKGVHACLLICDGSFGGAGDDDGGTKIDTTELARAVQYLHEQGRSAWTHELVVTPVGDRWTP